MSDLLPVTQADRDAVQAFHRTMAARLMSDIASERPTLGKDEGDAGTLVQAFARHRLAALDSRAGEDVRPDSWTAAPEDVRERAQLLADVELHLKSSRVFVTTREKMHPCGVELHDELLGRVTAAIDSIGKAKGHD